MTRFIVLCFLLIFFSCTKREEITQYAPIETYPSDTILNSIDKKIALAITAHDDDLAIMAGTFSKLKKDGWSLLHVYFPHKDNKRKEAHQLATKLILDSVFMFGFDYNEYRFDLDSDKKSWEPMPLDEFHKTFNYPLFETQIMELAKEFSPSVIFTLDSDYGAYGNPEHIFISKLVLDLAKADSIAPDYIYQGVMTKHMEQTIIEERHSRKMKSWGYEGDGWKKTRLLYRVDGMPEPNVQINITTEAKSKMNYLKSNLGRQRKTLGTYLPAFEEYDAEEYFEVFDREFFRVLKIN